jgi:integrase
MALTDVAAKGAKPQEKAYKLSDEKGMFLLVTPTGSKWWRLKYRFAGKEKLLSLGVYPEIGVRDARDRRDAARKLLLNGIDPSIDRQMQKAASTERSENSFERVAREWFAKFSPKWAPGHASKIIRRLERDVFPWIGGLPVAEIKAPQLLATLRRIEERGAIETAHRAQQNCSQVFRYAVATGRAERDPSTDLRGALPPAQKTHLAAIVEPVALGALLRAIEGYSGSPTTKAALRLAPLVFVRPGELRMAEWEEFDFEAGEWRLPARKMKMGAPHIVPLCKQALQIIDDLKPITGHGRYLFPGERTGERPISDNTLNAALRRLGYSTTEVTTHGFRATARTLLDEGLGYRVDWIEHQLAHAVKDPNGRAYNRTAHLDARRRMMQKWADYLDKLRQGAAVIPLKPRAA